MIASLNKNLTIEEEQALFILGNALQATGSLLSASITANTASACAFYQSVSAVIEAIGNTLQIIGAFILFENNESLGRLYIYYGSWIQAIGASFVFLFSEEAVTKNMSDEC